MSYKIGQFRRPQLSKYFTSLQADLDTVQTEVGLSGEDIVFINTCANLTGDNIVNSLNCYYLRFHIKQRPDSEQLFYLKLKRTSDTIDNEQLIEEFLVKPGNDVVYFETIISPNATYNQFLWELQRTALDYRMINTDETYGRLSVIEIDSYTKLIDIIGVLKTTYTGLDYLTKIGIQGPPSMLMCINREMIRIGKSGIYEINNNINITSLSFVPKESLASEDGLDYFIMDFEY